MTRLAHQVTHLLSLALRQLNAFKHAVLPIAGAERNIIVMPAFSDIVFVSKRINRNHYGGDEQYVKFAQPRPLGL
ncbi:hypothetical protein EDC52_10938 [Biostraticola tofi]|uniref:Uncharacterized protein n=1 Tax=Biostraticola tofi TaxID=466109 RepID=A0A4R3YMN0_9GAMM|nr:hypothetical protein EDC52_10938 [Biostraticola tofi]